MAQWDLAAYANAGTARPTNVASASVKTPEPQTTTLERAIQYAQENATIGIARDRIRPTDPTAGRSLWAWIERQRARYNQVRAQEVLETEIAQANETAVQTQAKLESFWNDARFDASVQKTFAGAGAGVGAGVGIGLALGAAIGSAAPVIGTIIGAVVGAAAGIIAAFIPFQYWEFYENFRKMLDALTTDERYIVYGTFRRLSDLSREKDQKPHYPAWQLIDCPFLCVRDGLANVVFTLFQAVWERDSIPADAELVPWALAAATAEAEPNQLLRDQWAFAKIVKDGEGSQWLVPHMIANGHRTAADLRASAGRSDVSDLAYPQAMMDRLLAAERAE